MRTALRRLAPVVLLATGACFATREDVRLLQTQMVGMRADAARADSAQQQEFRKIIASLDVVQDSLGLLSTRMMKMQGDVRGDLYGMGQQLIQIQELTGQSQRRLQELRSSLEQRSEDLVPGADSGVAPGNARGGAAQPGAGTPGPNQLFELSLDQLRRGSSGAAITGLRTLLQQYPTADVAPDAQFYLGEAYRSDGNSAAADSAYGLVMEKYPDSPRAPTALYKRALYLEDQGNLTGARAALNRLIQRYPRSDEAELAREHLRTMK
jgi:tol-pal system protein YbgF